ncbi:unnamed protein product [Pedinophyceae sp. YPF-701]|nr:unnamed protein product [Pedinophyceae sp. YPF-701]
MSDRISIDMATGECCMESESSLPLGILGARATLRAETGPGGPRQVATISSASSRLFEWRLRGEGQVAGAGSKPPTLSTDVTLRGARAHLKLAAKKALPGGDPSVLVQAFTAAPSDRPGASCSTRGLHSLAFSSGPDHGGCPKVTVRRDLPGGRSRPGTSWTLSLSARGVAANCMLLRGRGVGDNALTDDLPYCAMTVARGSPSGGPQLRVDAFLPLF